MTVRDVLARLDEGIRGDLDALTQSPQETGVIRWRSTGNPHHGGRR